MRATRPASQSRTWLVARRLRFRLVDFLVRMCDLKAWPALNLPVAVLRNRLAAARLVLILGIRNSVCVLGLPTRAATLRSRFPSLPKSACDVRRGGPVAGHPASGRSHFVVSETRNFSDRPLLLPRPDHHRHLAAFQARELLHHSTFDNVRLDAPGQRDAEFLMRHLAATEADVDLDLVAFRQKPLHVAQLDVVVAHVGSRAELQFLDLDLLGPPPLFVRLLLLLELEL